MNLQWNVRHCQQTRPKVTPTPNKTPYKGLCTAGPNAERRRCTENKRHSCWWGRHGGLWSWGGGVTNAAFLCVKSCAWDSMTRISSLTRRAANVMSADVMAIFPQDTPPPSCWACPASASPSSPSPTTQCGNFWLIPGSSDKGSHVGWIKQENLPGSSDCGKRRFRINIIRLCYLSQTLCCVLKDLDTNYSVF